MPGHRRLPPGPRSRIAHGAQAAPSVPGIRRGLLAASATAALALGLVAAGCATPAEDAGAAAADGARATAASGGSLTVYSGRSEALVGPLLERFEAETGIDVDVAYQGTAALASQILTEGDAGPADVFLAQDVGYLDLLGRRGALRPIDASGFPALAGPFISPDGWWVGTSARARVLVISPQRLPEAERPASLRDLADSRFRGRIGWAPGNASLHAHLSVLRHVWGEEETRSWLAAVKANDPTPYPKNSPQVKAVAAGEIDVGWVNHYYLHKMKDQVDDGAANYSFPNEGDAGNVLMPSGVGILAHARRADAALRLVEFLLTEPSQRHFAQENFEYPAVAGVATHPDVPPLEALELATFDPIYLTDLEGTLAMLRDLGLQ